ncbi:MAG: hypothetical protein PVH61_42025 [Candidatus Aminicenantes bacterium]|jgi:hypothetical protein
MMKTTTALVLTIFIGLFLSAATTPQQREASFQQHLDMKENSVSKNLKWRNIGPILWEVESPTSRLMRKIPISFSWLPHRVAYG